jgi:hypothetical protein
MGAEQEAVVQNMLIAATGPQQRVDDLLKFMSEDIFWQASVPSRKPVVGIGACRAEIERQNSVANGGLTGREILTWLRTTA